MKKLLIIFIFILLLASHALAGTSYYVDPNSGTSSGTFANPWNKISDISITDTDDVYFKAGTECTFLGGCFDQIFNLDNIDGTSGDRTVIGCYWDDGGSPNTDCTGKTLPILEGNRDCTAGNVFPASQDDSGTHTGGDLAYLQDSGATWSNNEYRAEAVYNTTTGACATITSNTSTTITGTLNSGDWSLSDGYKILEGEGDNMIRKINSSTNAVVGYITIQDIHIKNSWGNGIGVVGPRVYSSGVDHVVEGGSAEGVSFIVQRCTIENMGNDAILISDYRNSEIGYNTVHDNVLNNRDGSNSGSAIIFQGNYSGLVGTQAGTSHDNLIHHNTVYNCFECLTVYADENTTTIEYNTCYDPDDMCIYIQQAKDINVRYNLVYESTDGEQDEWGIWVENEDNTANNHCYIGGTDIYGNVVSMRSSSAGGNIIMGCQYCTDPAQYDCWSSFTFNVYNNTLINATNNFRFGSSTGTGSYPPTIGIKNNISLQQSGSGGVHTNSPSFPGTTWTTNSFNDDEDTVTGNAAASNVTTDDPMLRTSNFEVGAGGLSMADALLKFGSPVIGQGTDLGDTYDDDYYGWDRDPRWSLGALEYQRRAIITSQ